LSRCSRNHTGSPRHVHVARYDTTLRSKAASRRAPSSGPTADEVQNATEIDLEYSPEDPRGLNDREPEAEPALPPCAGGIRLREAVEDARKRLHRDPLTGIRHLNLDLGPPLDEPHLHASTPRRELDGIRQEVPDDLRQPDRFAGDGIRRAIMNECQRHGFRVRRRPDAIERAFNHRHKVDGARRHDSAATHDPRDV
jgi:hypothetical protein